MQAKNLFLLCTQTHWDQNYEVSKLDDDKSKGLILRRKKKSTNLNCVRVPLKHK